MVKLIYCFRKRADLSSPEFQAYWAEVHGPIAGRLPGLRRLVQVHGMQVPGDVRPPDFDGVAELWFEDAGALLRARSSAAWELSGRDETNFIDPGSNRYIVGVERTLVKG